MLLLRERGKDLLVQQAVLALDDALRPRRDLAEDLERGEAVGTARRRPQLDLLLQARDADLEELVQVRGDDAKELEALEQRHRAVVGLREHAAVELEGLQLAIEEMLVGGATRAWPRALVFLAMTKVASAS